MTGPADDLGPEPGVYLEGPDGSWSLVHSYADADYDLDDINGYFELGTHVPDEPGGWRFDRRQLQKLKALADHHSFDYPEEFIEMCLEMHRAALETPGDTVRFAAQD
jgi:hypothetical protein